MKFRIEVQETGSYSLNGEVVIEAESEDKAREWALEEAFGSDKVKWDEERDYDNIDLDVIGIVEEEA